MHRKCFPQTCRRALIAVKNMTRFDKYILHSAHLFDYFEHVYQLLKKRAMQHPDDTKNVNA